MMHKHEECKLVRLPLLLVWFLFPELLDVGPIPPKGSLRAQSAQVFHRLGMLDALPNTQPTVSKHRLQERKIINWTSSSPFLFHRLTPMERDATPFMPGLKRQFSDYPVPKLAMMTSPYWSNVTCPCTVLFTQLRELADLD